MFKKSKTQIQPAQENDIISIIDNFKLTEKALKEKIIEIQKLNETIRQLNLKEKQFSDIIKRLELLLDELKGV
jgi:hypothetical protein